MSLSAFVVKHDCDGKGNGQCKMVFAALQISRLYVNLDLALPKRPMQRKCTCHKLDMTRQCQECRQQPFSYKGCGA